MIGLILPARGDVAPMLIVVRRDRIGSFGAAITRQRSWLYAVLPRDIRALHFAGQK
jgi:hypothetical protein